MWNLLLNIQLHRASQSGTNHRRISGCKKYSDGPTTRRSFRGKLLRYIVCKHDFNINKKPFFQLAQPVSFTLKNAFLYA